MSVAVLLLSFDISSIRQRLEESTAAAAAAALGSEATFGHGAALTFHRDVAAKSAQRLKLRAVHNHKLKV